MVDSVQPVIMRFAGRVLAIGEELEIQCSGTNFFRLRSASADLHVRFNGGTAIKFSQGQSYNSPVALEKVTLSNQSGAANTVDVFISDGDVKDDALTVTAPLTIGGSVKMQVSVSTLPLENLLIAAGSRAVISSMWGTKRTVRISNPQSNFFPFVLGDNTTTATKGFLLNPGNSVDFETNAEISAFNTAPYAQKISALSMFNP